jgi:chorismate mutase/prephenate dehydratase
MSADAELSGIRARIDDLDAQIQDLVSQRAEAAREVARVKRERGEAEEGFYRPERELEVLRRVVARNQARGGPLPDEEMARLFREIMSACLALQQPLKVAFLGPEGTFTQAAALKAFGHSVETVALGAVDEVFREVESGQAHYGVVPVENSSEGMVSHTLDTFLRSALNICGEVVLRIHHHLLSRAEDHRAVRTVYAHQQALAQCREWLDANLPHVQRLAVSSNAEGARRAAEDPQAAAIAAEAAAEIYGLAVLCRNIEDEPDNTTRFLVIGRQDPPPTGADKTSLLVSGRNRAGILVNLLEPLSTSGVSMTRIESRPSRQALWEYVFFIDIEGHRDDPPVARAMAEIRERASLLKVLGSYPRATL